MKISSLCPRTARWDNVVIGSGDYMVVYPAPDSRRLRDGSTEVIHPFPRRRQRRPGAHRPYVGIRCDDGYPRARLRNAPDSVRLPCEWRQFHVGFLTLNTWIIILAASQFLFDKLAEFTRVVSIKCHDQRIGERSALGILHGHAHPADHLHHGAVQTYGEYCDQYQQQSDDVTEPSGHGKCLTASVAPGFLFVPIHGHQTGFLANAMHQPFLVTILFWNAVHAMRSPSLETGASRQLPQT